ncbi:MAG: M14 family zinc carboxypeptidase [Bacteroidales bacterium]|nr:M14 family zinc carboxypeptidase [Bacteroidales bacterium]
MNVRVYIILVILVILHMSIFPQVKKEELKKAYEYLNKKGEFYFNFKIEDTNILNELAKIVSIDKVKKDSVWAYANKKELEKFLKYNINFQVLPHPGDVVVEMFNGKGIWDFDTYPTYTQYETMMQTFAQNYPSLCKIDTIGVLPSGRKLLCAVISDNVNIAEDEPQVFLMGTIHGDETTGYVLLLRLIHHLLTNYNSNTEVKDLVDNIKFYICPLANPDGTYAGGNNTVTGATRYNANNVDLNRNFPDPRAGQHPDGETWQPETIALMNYASNHNFTLAFNTHGGAELYNYPWDTWTTAQNPHADDNWFYALGREFADTAQYYGPPGYFNDENNGVTQGGDWYVITGGHQDYMTYFHRCREVTLEISTTKMPPANQLPSYWNYLNRSFIHYIKHALWGIRGIITDSCTGMPLKAKVFINNHDKDSSHVYSILPIGNYHRPIFTGTWSVTYSAPGYQPYTTTITVPNIHTTVIRNVALIPMPPVADFEFSQTSECSSQVIFSNTSQAPVGSTYLWQFGDGNVSTEVSPVHVYSQNGTYNVTLIVSNSCAGSDTIVKQITINGPTITEVYNDTVCVSGQATLIAQGNGTFYWYLNQTDTTPIFIGDTLITNISTTTTFYVESHIQHQSIYGGSTQSNINGSYYTQNLKHYLVFNCYQPVKLVSVEVNAFNAGNRTIELQDSQGNVLQSKTINIPQGISRITLNFDLPQANNLRLVGPANSYLFRNTSGANYPYQIGNYITITGNSANNLNYYYYFYKWEIKPYDCISEKVPITAVSMSPPIVNVEDSILTNNLQVYLCGEVSGGSGNYTYLWTPSNFLVNPDSLCTYTINLEAGNSYQFILTVHDISSNCEVSETTNVIVTNVFENNISNITIKQNLTTQNIEIISDIFISEYRLFDLKGRIIKRSVVENKIASIDLTELKNGMYLLQILSDKKLFNYRVLKL